MDCPRHDDDDETADVPCDVCCPTCRGDGELHDRDAADCCSLCPTCRGSGRR